MAERPGSPRARLFLALDLPERAASDLAAWRDAACASRTDLRLVRPEALHVTLVFLGYRPEKEIPALARVAFDAVRDLPTARLTPLRIAAIPPRRPRLFALDLDDDCDRAATIQASMSAALADARVYVPERRPFWPHITFARVKRGARAEPLDTSPLAGSFDAAAVTLYRSRLSAAGARYEALERLRLGESALLGE